MTASEAVRDAHHRALRWSHVLMVQIERLYADRDAVLAGQAEVRRKSFYGQEDSHPFFVMEADAHFAMVAGRQLLRALMAFDGRDRMPTGMTHNEVRLLRDALEHWDEPEGRAARQMQKRGADPASHRWSRQGPGILGNLISDSELRAWAAAVYDDLVGWDPWYGVAE